ncbi:metal-dependent hydrolase [Halococcus qingdaonensis]|uniref:metal-dependent hydrolase n=1 Tax=Halococcus qingdaonensis TaxID=224402 RepID=UPI0021166224
MWPWGHLAVGYLVYTALSRWRFGRAPSAGAAVAVAVGTQFPDLVDKPLAWTFHVLPSGRSFAHSLLTAAIVCTLVYAYARRHGLTRPALAFAVGYVTHPFADALSPLLAGEYAYVRYLGWPVLDQPAYDTSMGFAIHLLDFELTPLVAFEFLLVALAVLAWLRDGRPGLGALRGWYRSRRSGSEG